MKKIQITSLLMLAFVWLSTCGFASIGESAATGGIADVVETMTLEHFEKVEIMEEWENLCMPNVKEYVTIRTEQSKDSEAVGRLYKGGAAEVIEYGDEWTKVVSGDCEGYIATEYLEFGADAKEIAQRDCSNVATVTTQTLKVRAEASEDSKTKDLIGLGEKADVIGEENGWLKIKYEDGEAYIKAEYATVEFEVGEAQTMEQIRAAEEAAEAAKKAKNAPAPEKKAETQEETEARLEEYAKREAEANEKYERNRNIKRRKQVWCFFNNCYR